MVQTKAMGNGARLTRLFETEQGWAPLYLTHTTGTASGRMHSDVYVGNVFIATEDDDMPAGWDLIVCGRYGPASGAYCVEGVIRPSGSGWAALDMLDSGAKSLGTFESAAKAVNAITGKY